MNAAFITDGSTTTQRALLSKSCGMSSGTFRISSITVPAFSMRFPSSLSLSPLAGAVNAAGGIRSNAAARYFVSFITFLPICFSIFTWTLSAKFLSFLLSISRDQDNSSDQSNGAKNRRQPNRFVFVGGSMNRANVYHILMLRLANTLVHQRQNPEHYQPQP